MDTSKRNSGDLTSASMYFSFDSEYTAMSSVVNAYNTADAINNISSVSATQKTESDKENMDITLEAGDRSMEEISPLKTLKKSAKDYIMTNSPLRALSKNIMQQFNANAHCSTPSQEQLKRSVETTRGSDAEVVPDLGLDAFDMQNKNHCALPDENKDNAHTDNGDGSILLTSSSVETAITVIEQKMCTLSTKELEDKNDEENKKQIEIISEGDSTIPVKSSDAQVDDIIPVANVKSNKKVMPEKTGIEANINTANSGKTRRSIAVPKNNRKTICEPDLKANRPSRILIPTSKKRVSILPQHYPGNSVDVNKAVKTELKKPLIKQSKIPTVFEEEKSNVEVNKTEATTSRKLDPTKNNIKKRTSLLPTAAAGEKRPYNFSQRMSIVVKTTLNSPARKIARKSVLPKLQPIPKTVMPGVTDTDLPSSSKTTSIGGTRQSLMPTKVVKAGTTAKTTSTNKAPTSIAESASKVNPNNRKSIYPTVKQEAECKKPFKKPSVPKTSATGTEGFVCNVCNSKFRIKSLLDAHKLSHFEDKPVVISTPTPTLQRGVSESALINKCKYCDKKFALVRALHIHLLQNCTKIPPSEKRKLEYTEMNHVEKAQLPHFFNPSAVPQNSKSKISSSNSNLSSLLNSSLESLVEGKDSSNSKVDCTDAKPTPKHTNSSSKKKIPYSGIHRTPSKKVICHTCKLSFKNVLQYANHTMNVHLKGGSPNPMETETETLNEQSPNEMETETLNEQSST